MENISPKFLMGGGEMGKLIRAKDWSKTPLGLPENWPSALKILTSIVLNSPFPMLISWGKEYIQIYNDGYRPILGSTKHPQAIGNSTKETFAEIWHIIGCMFDGVMEGKAVGFPDFKLPLNRHGYIEECYFDFSYSPVTDEFGNVGGVLVTVVETTENVKTLISLKDAQQQLELAKKEIEGKRDKLKRFLMQAPAGICVLDGPDLVFELVNPGYQQFFSDRELLGKPLLEAIPEIIGQPIAKIIFDVYQNDEIYEGKEQLVPLSRKNNGLIEDRYFNFIYQPKHNIEGKVNGVLVFAFEITDLVEIKSLVKESAERFKSIINQSPVPMLVAMGEDMVFEEINPPMLGLLEKDISIKGLPLNEALPEKESNPFIEKIKETYNTGKPWTGIEQLIYNDSKLSEKIGYFNVSYTPFIENGKIMGVLQSALDITEQVTARRKLEEAEDTLKLAVSAAQLGTFDMDLEKGTMNWDARCRKLFGISHNNPVSYEIDFTNGLHPDDSARVLEVINNVFIKSISNGHYDVEYRTIGFEDGEIRWVRAMGKAYFDEFDKPLRFIGSVLDITEFKQDEIRKNDFIVMVSHELKTPLTSISGFSQLLHIKSKNNGDEFCADILGKMIIQIKKMTSMINGFLNISRLESGKIHLDKKEFDFNVLFNEIIDDIKLTTASHNLNFKSSHPSIFIIADRDKIGSVMTNLIGNAVKYSPNAKEIYIDL
jgi:two-component system sensor histidine kinase VicK